MKKKQLLFVSALIIFCANISSFAQSCLPLGITFNSQTQIDDFATNYPGCTHVLGSVIINKTPLGNITNLNGLNQIERISGHLIFKEDLELSSATGLENLNFIGESLTIFNFSLNSLSGLNALDTIGAGMRIEELSSPISFQEFQRLKFIGGDVEFENVNLVDFSGLEQLTQINGNFRFLYGSLNSFQGLNNVKNIQGNLSISNPTNFATDFSGFENLQSIGGSFEIAGLAISNLNGLQNLTSINGQLFLVNNNNLLSLQGIANLNPATISSVWITSNDKLSVCEEPVICNFLLSGNYANFNQNAPGCNSIEEINLACAMANFSSVHVEAYYDLNQNKIQEIGEAFFADAGVTVDPLGIVYYTSSTDDGGVVYLEYGNYNIGYDTSLTPNWSLTTDSSSFSVSLSALNTSDTISFGLYPNKVFSEMVTTINAGLARCDQWVEFEVHAKNIGTTFTEGTLWFALDSNIMEVMFLDTPQVIQDDLYGWEFEGMFPGESITKQLLLKIPGAEDFTLGDSLHLGSYIGFTIPVGGVYSSRYFNYDPIVRCSFDPNDKLVYPQRVGDYTLFDEDLFYTIRFQNTGNDVAYDVVVLDTLDENLDPTSFSILSTSHPYFLETTIEAERYIRFAFDDIFLPDSTSNFEGSQGYVSYKISSKTGLAEETNIENTASIYFDTNPPIVTNTTKNLMVSELPMPLTTEQLTQEQFHLSLFPNPTTSELQIMSKDLRQANLELMDLNGRVLLQQQFNYSLKLNLDTYPSGLYFIRLIKDGYLTTKKIVKY